jgi:hypothetical protein
MIAYAFLQYRASPPQGGKKESTAHRPSQLCLPYVTPFSRSWLDRLHSNVHTAENGYVASGGMSKNLPKSKVLLG